MQVSNDTEVLWVCLLPTLAKLHPSCVACCITCPEHPLKLPFSTILLVMPITSKLGIQLLTGYLCDFNEMNTTVTAWTPSPAGRTFPNSWQQNTLPHPDWPAWAQQRPNPTGAVQVQHAPDHPVDTLSHCRAPTHHNYYHELPLWQSSIFGNWIVL